MSQRLFNLVTSDGRVLLENGTQAQCSERAASYYSSNGSKVLECQPVGLSLDRRERGVAQPELPIEQVNEPTEPETSEVQEVLVAKSTIIQAGELVLTQYPNSNVAKRASRGQALTNKQITWLAGRAAALRELELAMA